MGVEYALPQIIAASQLPTRSSGKGPDSLSTNIYLSGGMDSIEPSGVCTTKPSEDKTCAVGPRETATISTSVSASQARMTPPIEPIPRTATLIANSP